MEETQPFTLSSETKTPIGTGGFLDPESVADGFEIKEGMIVSDFGCGAGYFTIILAERVGKNGRVYALDVQEIPLDNVNAKARVKGLTNIETIRANLEIPGSSGLSEGSQDVVLLANILFQSNKRPDIIKEGKRVLKSGGTLIIIDWKKGGGGFGPPDDIRPDPEEIRKMAEDQGFIFQKNIEAGTFHFGSIYKNK
jgi:SAM-dependent methyltransferase